MQEEGRGHVFTGLGGKTSNSVISDHWHRYAHANCRCNRLVFVVWEAGLSQPSAFVLPALSCVMSFHFSAVFTLFALFVF